MNKARKSYICVKQFFKFGMIGVINTMIGALIMFALYNLFGFGYWVSTALSYILTSFLSYFLNKKFTFKVGDSGWTYLFKFGINILVCYFLSYGIAKRAVYHTLKNSITDSIADNISMMIGMILFVFLNFFGQKIFVFSDRKRMEKNE